MTLRGGWLGPSQALPMRLYTSNLRVPAIVEETSCETIGIDPISCTSSGAEASDEEEEIVVRSPSIASTTPPSLPNSWVRKSKFLPIFDHSTPQKMVPTAILAAVKKTPAKEETKEDDDVPVVSIKVQNDKDCKMEKVEDIKTDDNSKIYKEGYLLKQASGVSRDWQRRFFRLRSDTLEYWPSDLVAAKYDEQMKGKGKSSIEGPKQFSLISSVVKQQAGNEMGPRYRPDRFVLHTPNRALLCEAANVASALEWCTAIEARIQASLRERSSSAEDDIGFSQIKLSVHQAIADERLQKLHAVPGNSHCADCGAEKPDWACIKFNVLICINCAGAHRSLGSHVSRIKSLVFDDWSTPFDHAVTGVLGRLGNRLVNAHIHSCKPSISSDCTTEERSNFVKQKYVELEFSSIKGNELFESVRSDDILPTWLMLVSGSVDPNAVMPLNGMTPLHVAATSGQLDQIVLLLVHGAKSDVKDGRGRTPAEVALRSGNGRIASLLTSRIN